MHITTRGGSKTQKKYVKSIADFCGEKLLGSRLYPKIELRIELVKDLMKKEKVYGDAIWEDEERYPKEFTIRADASQPLRRVLETIAHEMVHVKQYARKELRDVYDGPWHVGTMWRKSPKNWLESDLTVSGKYLETIRKMSRTPVTCPGL